MIVCRATTRALIVSCVLLAACGKKGPPLPPLQRIPVAPADFAAYPSIKVMWEIALDGTMPNVHELIRDHVTLSIRCLDRLYLHGYMPKLQTSGGLCYFLRDHLGHPIPSPAFGWKAPPPPLPESSDELPSIVRTRSSVTSSISATCVGVRRSAS